MNFLKKLFGKDKKDEKQTSKSVDEKLDEAKNLEEVSKILKEGTKELVEQNKIWQQNFDKLNSFRSKARELEKNGILPETIEFYKKAVNYGEECETLNYVNYGHDIQRLIILYSKTKSLDKLSDLLNHCIDVYSDRKEVEDWKKRLDKLKK